ncbi:MAG: oligoendopeptidase F, partial [Chloroflexi bacterium]|nr:oligoendopeptidase F [Chloroflexota bacterium]
MAIEVRERTQIPKQFTWNAESVFATSQDWETEFTSLGAELEGLAQYHGKLAEGPATLLAALERFQELFARAWRLYQYAVIAYSVDTRQQEAAQRHGRSEGILAQATAAVAFLDPELIAIGEPTLRRWLQGDPRLV